jgi:pantothenate kinase
MTTFDGLVARARGLVAPGRRAVLGIVGSPGAGKSTLAEALLAALRADPPPGAGADWVAHVPMDGYHLADVELERLGLRHAKGAPDTFDAAGYAALLARLRPRDGGAGEDGVVYAPAFERTLEQPLAGAIPVLPAARLVVTEGNYLLLDEGAWPRARSHLAEVWYVDVDDDLRRRRLVDRHVQYGKTRDAAAEWVDRSDEVNARRVRIARAAADLVVTMDSIDATPTAD